MIFIFSTEDMEVTTCEVMDWLYTLQADCRRINGEDFFTDFTWTYDISDNKEHLYLNVNGEQFTLDNIKALWYRRTGGSRIKPDFTKIQDEKLSRKMEEYMWSELKASRTAFFNSISRKPCLTYPNANHNVDKQEMLYYAIQSGLTVPQTIIASSKAELVNFYNKYPGCIIKAIANSEVFEIDNKPYFPYTEMVSQEFINTLPDRFFSFLLQEHLTKECEIRTFYLDGECYSMAIFSQKDAQTQVDFRRYNKVKPNRNVPYKLPEDIEKQIKDFMQSVNLNTGSLDIIKTTDGRHVF
ncbi:MAG: grasp-with-spasm system ATP-grasp peptide maturase [Chitinophagaceae bacterium]|nr:grasp-with-spasm system ATP-grasp peptide maturase [Chitinophagaceae bacterium]